MGAGSGWAAGAVGIHDGTDLAMNSGADHCGKDRYDRVVGRCKPAWKGGCHEQWDIDTREQAFGIGGHVVQGVCAAEGRSTTGQCVVGMHFGASAARKGNANGILYGAELKTGVVLFLDVLAGAGGQHRRAALCESGRAEMRKRWNHSPPGCERSLSEVDPQF